MNRLSLVTTNPWSRRRWVATALGILGLQITAILLLDRQKLRTASATHFGPGVQFAMDAASTKRWIESPLSLDPTVFGLPHSDGFSGTAWLDAQSMEYQAKEWTEPPRWLEPSPQYFGSFFASFVAEEKPGVLRIADKSIPALNASDVWISSDAIAATTDLQAEGAAARRLIRPETNSLPSWPHSDILSNTVVQIVIDAAGIPVSTTLLAGQK